MIKQNLSNIFSNFQVESAHIHAAINTECLAGDVLGLIPKQEGHSIGHFLGVCNSLHRDFFQYLIFYIIC